MVRTRLPRGVLRGLRQGPLALPAFRLLVAGVLTSSIGDLCYAVALPWLILSDDGGTVRLGAVLAVYGIARALGIPAGGVLTDRIGPRRVLLSTDIVRCATTCILGAQVLAGVPSLTLLLVLSAIQGACGGLFQPASLARVPDLVPEEQLAAGNSIDAAMGQLGNLLGPAVGGALIAAVGAGAAILVDAGSFAISAMTLLAIGWLQRGSSGSGELGGSEITPDEPAQETVSFREVVLRGRLFQVLFVASLIGNFVYVGAYDVALPALSRSEYGAAGYGILLTTMAVGLLAGSLAVRRWQRRVRPGIGVVLLTLAMAVAVSLVPYLGGLAGAGGAILFFGVSTGASGVLFITMLQLWSPRALLGRIMSMIMLASLGTYPLSVLLCGYGVRHIGVTAFFPASGALMGCAALLAFSQRAVRNYQDGDCFSNAQSPAKISARDQVNDRSF